MHKSFYRLWKATMLGVGLGTPGIGLRMRWWRRWTSILVVRIRKRIFQDARRIIIIMIIGASEALISFFCNHVRVLLACRSGELVIVRAL